MTLPRRPRAVLAVLAASLLVAVAASSVDGATARSATRYRAGAPITLDTNLLSDSGATAWAINAYLAANTPLPPLGEAFMAAEADYGVNAKFLLAAAMHESGMGTSDIARIKHNLFGFNAYDRDPFRYASAYETYAASIDAAAKFMRSAYLLPTGRYWGGAPTLRAMQLRWSTSRRWGTSISNVANGIGLATFDGKSVTFAAPVVGDGVHAGDQLPVDLRWSTGDVPAGTEFAATWTPVQLDSDAVAETVQGGQVSTLTLMDRRAGPTAGMLSLNRPPVTSAAPRLATADESISLDVTAPLTPGRYQLQIEMRDAGLTPLPAGQRTSIRPVAVRVWGEHAVSVQIGASADGTGALVEITNTGRTLIPAAAPAPDPTAPPVPDLAPGPSYVTISAAADPGAETPTTILLSVHLAADLPPGGTVAFLVPAVADVTGRAVNWLTVDFVELGDPTLLAAYSPVSAWFSTGPEGTGVVPTPPGDGAGGGSDAPVPTPSPTPEPTPEPVVEHVTTRLSERSTAIDYRGIWKSASGPYQGGQVVYATSPGATATLTFTGTSVTWIGPLGPTRGVAEVAIDGRSAGTVNLWRSSFSPQALLFTKSLATAGRHTLTIRVLSSPGHPFVAIDGFLVRS